MQLLDKEEGLFSLSCKFKLVEEDLIWIFSGVYGPGKAANGEKLWLELSAIKSL